MTLAIAPADARATPVMKRIARVSRETADVFTWHLEHDGTPFEPGQFDMLYAFGAGEVAISISGDPSTHGELVHTIRAVGAVTSTMKRLRRGDVVGVRGPFGVGWPVRELEGGDVVVVAGGLGLAPLRPAILHLLAHRERYGRVAVLVGARSPDDLLFRRQLERWRGRLDVSVHVTVDHAPATHRGHVGVVTSLLPRLDVDPSRARALVCGPEIMMRAVARELARSGVPSDRVWVSLERNMQCGYGVCGRCQLGPLRLCVDGPVVRLDRAAPLLSVRDL